MIALDEFLDAQPIEGIETVPSDSETGEPSRFKLTSPDAADWAFRKLQQEKDRKAEALEQAAVHRERIDMWVEEVCGPIDHSIEYFEGLLTEWGASQVLPEFAEKLDWSKVTKTHSTPNGKVSARRSEDGRFVASDEGRKGAVELLQSIGRHDLLAMQVGATPLEKGREAGTVRLNDNDEYEVVAQDGTVHPLPGVRREGRGQITFTVST